MKKSFLLALALLFVASPAFASNAYNPIEGKCLDGDLSVYDSITYEVESCLPKVDVDKASADAQDLVVNHIVVPRGTSVLTTYGFVDTCPVWFPFWMDCWISPSLFDRFVN